MADRYASLNAAFYAFTDISESWKALHNIESNASFGYHVAWMRWDQNMLADILKKPITSTAVTSRCLIEMLCLRPHDIRATKSIWLRRESDSLMLL